MPQKEWLKSLHSILSDKKHAELEKCESLKCILKKLKKQQHDLKDKIDAEKDQGKKKHMKKKLAIIRTQRKKGLSILKAMNKK